jgi:hypothetical protein
MSQDKCPRTNVPGQMSQDKCPRTNVPGQMSQDKCPRTNVPGQMSKVKGPELEFLKLETNPSPSHSRCKESVIDIGVMDLAPSTPREQATPETATWPFQRWWHGPSSIPLNTPCHMPMREHVIELMVLVFISGLPKLHQTEVIWRHSAVSTLRGRVSRGIRGRPKVMLAPGMPYHSMPCRQPPLKRPYGRFRGGCLQGGWPAAVSLPPWIPHAIHPWLSLPR